MIQATALTGTLGLSFKRGANEDAYRRARQQHRAAQERDRRQKESEARADAADFGDLAASVITIEQAETFRVELDAYQAATIEALQVNQQALELARERLSETLAQAHVLEDGRRVFETEDGLRVFDEFGNELSPDVITPDEIPNHKPSWEYYLEGQNLVRELEAEQTELLDYQADLDDAAERLDSGDLTVQEFDELRSSLRESAPDAVRARISGMEPREAEVTITIPSAAPNQNTALNLDADLSNAIQPSIPGLGR